MTNKQASVNVGINIANIIKLGISLKGPTAITPIPSPADIQLAVDGHVERSLKNAGLK